MTQTPFQYFIGPNTMFPDPTTKVRIADILDGTSQTFLFAEARDMAPWAKPADMVITPNGPLPLPEGGFLAAMADGSVRFISRGSANDQILRQLIDSRDGQILPPNWDN